MMFAQDSMTWIADAAIPRAATNSAPDIAGQGSPKTWFKVIEMVR